MRAFQALALLLLGACAIPNTIETLDETSPPPEFGRPAWVRACAGAGGWIGGVLGGVVAVVALPITWPLSVLAGDHLGEGGRSEFLMLPAVGGAAIGHAALGGPADVVDWVFRRAWVDAKDPVTDSGYEFVKMPDATVPKVPAERGTSAAAEKR